MLDCDYSTTTGLPTHEMVMRDLDIHIRCVHSELSVSGSNQGKTAVAGKSDRLPRPTDGEGITKADWIHFCDKWARYKRSTLVGAGPDLIRSVVGMLSRGLGDISLQLWNNEQC